MRLIRSLTATAEPSLFEELWAYFEDKYFTVHLGQYEHLEIGSGSIVTLRSVVLGIAIGVILAAGVACYDKRVLGSFVRRIIQEDCLSPERAKTLAELCFARKTGVKASLRSQNKLGRVVRCVEKEAYEREVETARAAYIEANGDDKKFFMPPYRMNFETDHFYIPDEEHYRAEIRFEGKGSGWLVFILVSIVAIVAASLACIFLPDMLQLVDNMLGILAEN